MIITILKIAGLILIAAGIILGVYTVIDAGRTGLKEDLAELKLIKENGYTKQHSEERLEDVYKKEPVSPAARSMSRRAKRVLERMSEAEDAAREEINEKPAEPVLEEIKPDDAEMEVTDVPVAANPEPEDRLSTDEEAAVSSEEGTDVLSEEGTDVLNEEGTAVLGEGASCPEGEKTGVLDPCGEGTDVLEPGIAGEEQTDVLTDPSEGTDILEGSSLNGSEAITYEELQKQQAYFKSGEDTDILVH